MAQFVVIDFEVRGMRKPIQGVYEARNHREAFALWLREAYLRHSEWEIVGRGQMRVPYGVDGKKMMAGVLFEALLPRSRRSMMRDPCGPRYEEETGVMCVRLACDSDPV